MASQLTLDIQNVQQKLLFDGVVQALKKSVDTTADDAAKTAAIATIEDLQKTDPLLRQDKLAEDIQNFTWEPVEYTLEQYMEQLKKIDDPQKEILRIGDREYYNTKCGQVLTRQVNEREVSVPVAREWAKLARTQPNDTYSENTCVLYADHTTHKVPDWVLTIQRLKDLSVNLHYSEAHIKSALIRLSTFFEGRIASIVLAEMSITDGARWLMGRSSRKNIVLELYDLLRTLVRKKDTPIGDMINLAKGIGFALFRRDTEQVQENRLNKFLIHTLIVFTEGEIKAAIVNEVKRCQLDQRQLPKWERMLESTERAETVTHKPTTDLYYNDKSDKKFGIDLFHIKINDPHPQQPGLVSSKLETDSKPKPPYFPTTSLENDLDHIQDPIEEPLGGYQAERQIPDEVLQSPKKPNKRNTTGSRQRKPKPPKNPDFDRVTRSRRSNSAHNLHNFTSDRYRDRRNRSNSRSRYDSRGRGSSRNGSRYRSNSRNSQFSRKRSNSRQRNYSKDRNFRNTRNSSRNSSRFSSANRSYRSTSRNSRLSNNSQRDFRRSSQNRNGRFHRRSRDRNGRSSRNNTPDRRNYSSDRYKSTRRHGSYDKNRRYNDKNKPRPKNGSYHQNNGYDNNKKDNRRQKGSSSYNTTHQSTQEVDVKENEDTSLNTMAIMPYQPPPDPFRHSDFTPLLEEI